MRNIRYRYHALLAAAVLLGSVIACHRVDSPTMRFGDATPLSGPTGVGTAPMFAVSPSGEQIAAWVSAPSGGTDGRLYISVDGRPPTEIRDSLGPIEAHGEAPPKVSYAANGVLYAVYVVGKVVPGHRFPLSALRLVKSSDDGKRWTAPVTVTGSGNAFGSHSFDALHVSAQGTVYVSWLGESTTWITHSTDGGERWSSPVRTDLGSSCPCCRTALATGSDGTLYLAWRHIYPGNVRDIVVARSTDHGTTWGEPVRVHADNWEFTACPHAGPSIAVDGAGRLHVAWWTGKTGSAGVFYAQSSDGGKSFTAPVTLGVAQFSQPSHVQLALASHNRVVVTWDDGTRQIPQVLVRESADDGKHFSDAIPLSEPASAATFPVLQVSGDSIAVAWSQESAEIARTKATAQDAMHHMHGMHGLDAVGSAQVIMRRGIL